MNRIKEFLFQRPCGKINVSTKARKDLLINDDPSFIFQGDLYDIKFKNIGGGVWEATADKRNKSYVEGKQIHKV